MRHLLIWIIELYQRYLSPDHSLWARSLDRPPYCRFTPSCSMYAKEAIEKRGVIIGSGKAIARLMRCHPWSAGGYDPVDPDPLMGKEAKK